MNSRRDVNCLIRSDSRARLTVHPKREINKNQKGNEKDGKARPKRENKKWEKEWPGIHSNRYLTSMFGNNDEGNQRAEIPKDGQSRESEATP